VFCEPRDPVPALDRAAEVPADEVPANDEPPPAPETPEPV
jgi:hypothetical protein